ncbi:Rhodanese-like domain-containing protein [Rhodotorula toruloides]|uniref:Rhodanese-like domain-containing protein n=1 Tax=Rhodotorula toruloides TaxID=5286 RepID=A0A2T0A627_RHOTO|nr:Rhodanese-like domain-containing protein [Rhodotorula toruloides]
MLSRSVSSTASRPVSLITPAELHKLLSSKNEEELPCVLDASWHMPGSGRQPFQEYRKKRIEGAAFWDVDQIASESDVGVPHNMPSASQFEDACSRLGIKRDSHVVVYDTVGVFSSPRTAFTFKHFNHPQVSVLDGGLPRWIAEGYPIDENRPTNPNPHAYKVDGGEKSDVRQWKDMTKNIKKGEKGDVVVDARAAGRFHGTDPEPREGLSSGHMPHSISLPFQSALSPESSTTPPYRTLLKPEELEKVFVGALGKEKWEKVKQGEKSVTATCGSGMTAAVLWLALQRAGVTDNTAIYDESWTGYASRPESKIVKS